MKCPNCKSEMEDGTLAQQGNVWVGKGLREKLSRLNFLIGNSVNVSAYRCPKCGKVELTTYNG